MKRSYKTYAMVFIFALIFAGFFTYIVRSQGSKIGNDKNTLFIAFESKVQTFDPRIIGTDANSQYMEELRFLPLISFDEAGNIRNVVAESIIPKSNKSWNIKLKKGILFASGKELTADDVLATYQSIMNPAFGFPVSPRKGAFKNITKFNKISANEIYIELKEPDASFLNNLSIGLLPEKAAQSALPNDVNGKEYESGPFVLKRASDTNLLLIKNEKYNYTAPIKIQEVNFKIIPDAGTRYAALIKGDIDIIQNTIDPDKVATIEKEQKDKFNVYKQIKQSTTYLGINFRDPLLKNINIRRAIAYAIDRKNILKYRLRSEEEPATSMFPSKNLYFDKEIASIEYNPEKAKSLIKESGVSLPIILSLKVSNSNKSNVEVAKAIGANLVNVGFIPKIESLENSIFQEQIRRGVSQIWMSPWTGFKDPDHLRFVFSSDMVPPNGGNRGAYSNPELDKLLQKGREELNAVERKKIYNNAQKIIAEDLPYVFLWHGQNTAVVSHRVHGFELYSDGRYWSLVNVTKK